MKAKVKTITPELAKELLKNNNKNRKLHDEHLNHLCDEIRKGNWKLTGESIKISKTNQLLDGQHRLNAIIKTGIAIDILVLEDLEDEIFTILDTGKVRSSGDILDIENYKNAYTVAAVMRFILNYEKGIYDSRKNDKRTAPTNKEILDLAKQNEQFLIFFQENYNQYRKFSLLPVSMLFGLYYVCEKINTEVCEEFFQKLITGLDLEEDCPIKLLRERLIRDTINKTRLNSLEKVKLFITTWNYYRTNKKVKSLKILDEVQIPI